MNSPTNKARFQKLSKQAAAYCKKQDQNDTHWRVETLYHGLLANNLKAKEDFVKQASDWYDNLQYDKLESLTQTILEAVNSKFVVDEVAAWAALFQAMLDILYSRYLSAQILLQQALKQKTNKLLTANCIKSLGDVYYYLYEQDQALDYYQKALFAFQHLKNYLGEAICINSLADVYYASAEYTSACVCYKKALRFFKNSKCQLSEANCIVGLGSVHLLLGEHKLALECYQEALLINQEAKAYLNIANCIRQLSQVYYLQEQTVLAITTLQEAAQLYEKFGNQLSKASCFDDIATIYQRQKQFEPALIAFNQAIEIFPDTNWYQNRASLYMAMENYEKAEADIKQAESMGKNLAGTLLRKAELALWQQQTPQSVEFSQQALAQRPADGNFRAFLALTLLANGQTEQANKEMQQALTAIYQPHDFADLLENIDKLSRIYGERLEFAQLRELICKHPHFKTL